MRVSRSPPSSGKTFPQHPVTPSRQLLWDPAWRSWRAQSPLIHASISACWKASAPSSQQILRPEPAHQEASLVNTPPSVSWERRKAWPELEKYQKLNTQENELDTEADEAWSIRYHKKMLLKNVNSLRQCSQHNARLIYKIQNVNTAWYIYLPTYISRKGERQNDNW